MNMCGDIYDASIRLHDWCVPDTIKYHEPADHPYALDSDLYQKDIKKVTEFIIGIYKE